MALARVAKDGGTQARVVVNAQVVEDYAANMRGGADFPPIVVFFDGRKNWLADGFHRIAAAKKARLPKLRVDVRKGSRRDAILFAVGANAHHGLRRTNADKRAAVHMLLHDAEWQLWSDSEIARQCAVSHTFVAAMRRDLSAETSCNVSGCDPESRKVIRGESVYLLNAKGIRAARERRASPTFHPPDRSTVVYAAIVGDSSDLICEVAALYLKTGDRIADVTYGHGVFWRQVDLSAYDFHPSDLVSCPNARFDFRRLPHAKETFDVLVLDPPFSEVAVDSRMESRYRNRTTVADLQHADVVELYRAGMKEAHRVLKPGGLLWVKCQDDIEANRQRWTHVEILAIAEGLGYFGKDLFLLTQKKSPPVQTTQQHARKNHSFLWVFAKRRPSKK